MIIRIESLEKISNKKVNIQPYVEEIRKIFFESSSRKSFKNNEEKENFFNYWLNPYLKNYKKYFLVAFNEDNNVLGYLTGCPDSHEAIKFFSSESYLLFKDLFSKFNAHLHINCSSEYRGQGIGQRLVEYYCSMISSIPELKGLHIVTSPDAKNKSFYLKLGFQFNLVRELNGDSYLFMGKEDL